MNLPNKITVFRAFMVPVYMATMLIAFPHHYLVSVILYFIACMSDTIDGNIARKNNLVTSFGAFLDPLVDKALTTSAILCIMVDFYTNPELVSVGSEKIGFVVIVMLILAREFAVAGIRMEAASKGKVVKANSLGKAKTFIQMSGTGMYALVQSFREFGLFVSERDTRNFFIMIAIWLWASAAITFVSGVVYIKDNASLISEK